VYVRKAEAWPEVADTKGSHWNAPCPKCHKARLSKGFPFEDRTQGNGVVKRRAHTQGKKSLKKKREKHDKIGRAKGKLARVKR